MTNLSKSAKFSVVNFEAIYMGEFVNGDTVPAPVSPVDGFTYDLGGGDVSFVFSWRWTPLSSKYTQPDLALGQLGPMHASVNSSSGNVSVSVGYIGGLGDGSLTTETTHGRIAVTAICQRTGSLIATGVNYDVNIAVFSDIPLTPYDGLFDANSVLSVYYDKDPFHSAPNTLNVLWKNSGGSTIHTDTVPIRTLLFLKAPTGSDKAYFQGTGSTNQSLLLPVCLKSHHCPFHP